MIDPTRLRHINDIIESVDNVLAFICLFVLLWNGYFLLFNKGIPNIRTAPAIRRRIIGFLKEDAAAKNKAPYTVIDLGSGNGLFTRQIARALPQARVIGYEISWPAIHWARLMQKLFGLKNIEYRRHDFFAADLSEADAVVMYLTIFQMEPMGKKLRENLKPGTLVTSNRFPLGGGWEPVETVKVFTLYPHQRTFRVYRR